MIGLLFTDHGPPLSNSAKFEVVLTVRFLNMAHNNNYLIAPPVNTTMDNTVLRDARAVCYAHRCDFVAGPTPKPLRGI